MTPGAVGRVFAVLATAALGLLLLWPDGEAIRQLILRIYLFGLVRGVPQRVGPDVYAAALNVLVFVPLGFAGVVMLRRRPVVVALSLLAVSASVELVQALPVLGRAPGILDVACNAAGGLVGAVLGSVVLGLQRQGQYAAADQLGDELDDLGSDRRR